MISKSIPKIQKEIKKHYGFFIKDLNINEKTGIVKKQANVKFATYPYIGENYLKGRILFIGMEVAKDSQFGIMDFDARRNQLKETPLQNYNKHIAGTYFCTIYFSLKLMKKFDSWYNKNWDKIEKCTTWERALNILNYYKKFPKANPISYIALTNRRKFVYIQKKDGTSGAYKKYFDRKQEIKLLLEEIKILNPSLIIFQSKLSSKELEKNLLLLKRNLNCKIFIGPHPSERKIETIAKYIKQLEPYSPSNV